MRKKLAGGLIALTILAGGLAWAAGGSLSDPLVSREYLEQTYAPTLLDQVNAESEKRLGAVYQTQERNLDAQTEEYRVLLAGKVPAGSEIHRNMEVATYPKDGSLRLGSGSCLLLLQGEVSAQGESTELIDVTRGIAGDSMSLTQSHRYIVGEGGTVTITVLSDTARLGIQGSSLSLDGGAVTLPFQDVKAGDWFYDAVCYVYGERLFQGVEADRFAPEQTMSRGMLATVLYRMAGEPSFLPGEISFVDVGKNLWYSRAVTWAATTGVITGSGNGFFQPDNAVTREQMALMLQRFAEKISQEDVTASGKLSRFADAESVSDWAESAMLWAVREKIVGGDNMGNLNPRGGTTRAEVSAMIQRLEAR